MPAVIVTGKAKPQRKFRCGSLAPDKQAIEIFFSAPTRNLSAEFAHPAHADMQMPAKEHGPRSVNAHSVICAFVLLTNRDSPTSSCVLARIRPVKIAPWSHSHASLPAARRPHRVPVCTSSWLSQYIGARFPTSASYFLRLLLLHPTLKTASPIFVYWIPEHLPCLMLLCSL